MSESYAFFLLYVIIGFVLTGAAFYWAVRAGLFKNQDRARYVVLDDIEPIPDEDLPDKSRWPAGAVVTIFLAALGVFLLVTAGIVIMIATGE